MKLYYFDSPIGNFGDDLNPWIWEKLLGDFNKYPEDKTFVGIGSVLDKRLNQNISNIIAGAGVRNFTTDLDIEKCKFIFVRGPISSKALNNVPYITDSAYCLALLNEFEGNEEKKKHKCSIIPYFRHLNSLNWTKLAKDLGYNFINITDPVEEVIKQIRESERVISGAMHGAIVADIYRVPWQRLIFGKHGYENFETSDLKWNDWLLSIDFSLNQINHGINIIMAKKYFHRNKVVKYALLKELNFKLKTNKHFYLSSNKVYNKRISELKNAIKTIKQERT